jgi:hypothetical protein
VKLIEVNAKALADRHHDLGEQCGAVCVEQPIQSTSDPIVADMPHLFVANSEHAAREAVHCLLLAVDGLALNDDGTQQHPQGARMRKCAALVRGDVPIERVLQTHALDKMIDDGQRAQTLTLQDEANHCTCPSARSVRTISDR